LADKGQSIQPPQASSLLAVRSWIQPSLLRLAPAWVVIAAALASGGLSLQRLDLLQLLLCVLLADAAAGQLWHVLVSRSTGQCDVPEGYGGRRPGIPYARPGSVAGRLGNWLAQLWTGSEGQSVSTLSHLVAAISAVVILAVALGPLAMAIAAGWLALAVGARLMRASVRAQRLSLSVFEVGLPWLLGYLTFWDGEWSVLALVLGAALVLLHSALSRLDESRSARWSVRLAQAAMLAGPVVARKPIFTVIVAAALLVPAALQMRSRWTADRTSWSTYRRATQIWWWLAMASAAWSIGTVSGLPLGV